MKTPAGLQALLRVRDLRIPTAIPLPKCPCCGARQWKLSCSRCGNERLRVSDEVRLGIDILHQKFFLSWLLFGRTFRNAAADPAGLLRGLRKRGPAFLDRVRVLRPASYFVSSTGILVLLYSLFAAESASSLAGSATYFVLFVLTSLCFVALVHRACRLLGGKGSASDTFAALVYGHGAQLCVVPLLMNLAFLSAPGASHGGLSAAIGGLALLSLNLAALVWAAVRAVPVALAEMHGFAMRRAYVAVGGVGVVFLLAGNLISPVVNLAFLR
jgi:hypothetical protein